MEEVHHWVFRGIVAVALVHVFGAMYHHFRLKDDVLKRMLPFGDFR
jgi:cytochrome b561